jgi:hypothetical protein
MLLPFLLLYLVGLSGFDHNLNSTPLSIGKGKMPSLESDEKGIVHLVFGHGDSLLYSISKDKGQSFSNPELIEIIDGLAADATRGPRVAVTKDGPVVVASTDAGNVWAFRKHGKRDWTEGVRLNDVDSVNLEGFVDVASDGSSNLFAVWLDLRGNKRNKLYGSRSSDGGKTWSDNIKVYESPDSTICECCRVTTAMKGNDVHIMFRNQLYGKRDLHLISSKNAGRTFGKAEKLGTGTWTLNGCPMDGGGMVITPEAKVQTVWRRESKIYFCEPGKPEVEVGEGKGCTIENVNGVNVFAWVKNGEVICKLPDGSIRNLEKGLSPALQSIDNDHFLCVWENDGQLYRTLIKL